MSTEDERDTTPHWAILLPLVPFCIFLLCLGRGVHEPFDPAVFAVGLLTWLRQWSDSRRGRST